MEQFQSILRTETDKIKLTAFLEYSDGDGGAYPVKLYTSTDRLSCHRENVFLTKGDIVISNPHKKNPFVECPIEKCEDCEVSIVTPFQIVVSVKKNYDLYDGLRNGYDWAQKSLQSEIDYIFESKAKAASLIIDQKSYDETPERYMLAPLLSQPEFCTRYGVTPILSYSGTIEKLNNSNQFNGGLSMIGLFGFFPECDLYIKKTANLALELSEKKYSIYTCEGNTLSGHDSLELAAEWGLFGKFNRHN